jgi:glycosyltransferase involved in cell wall biosynthesis
MRIFFLASYPDQPIGYSKVANVLSNWLAAQPGVELFYFGIGNNPEHRLSGRFIDPRIHFIDILAEEAAIGSSELYGIDIIDSWMRRVKPDVFLIYNDIVVSCRAFNALLAYRAEFPACRFVSYLDYIYPFEKLQFIDHVARNTDAIFLFSDCWKRHFIQDHGMPPQKIHSFPHGFNDALFYPVPAAAAKAFYGFGVDDFVILNTNRNTYRKTQDVLMRAFVDFLVREDFNPRIRLFINCAMHTTSGYDIYDLIGVEARRHGVPVSRVFAHIFKAPKEGAMSDFEINMMYNAADVGINTCMGEGFGLCNMEHAGVGKPQIVSAVGALEDIFADGGAILVRPVAWIRVPNMLDEHTGDLGVCRWEDFSAAMSAYFHDRDKLQKDGAWCAAEIPVRYAWPKLLEEFFATLKRT